MFKIYKLERTIPTADGDYEYEVIGYFDSTQVAEWALVEESKTDVADYTERKDRIIRQERSSCQTDPRREI